MGGTVNHDTHASGRGSRDPGWPVIQPQPPDAIILLIERDMRLKQDPSDSSMGLAYGFGNRAALVLPSLLRQEEVRLGPLPVMWTQPENQKPTKLID